MSDGLIILLFFCTFTAAVVAPILGLFLWLSFAVCSSQSSKMGLESSWGPLQECMVRVDGNWMLLDSYKVVKLRPDR